MGDIEEDQAPVNGGNNAVEKFVEVYVSKYSETVENSDIPDGFLPSLYGSFPYKVQIYRFDNGTMGVVFLKGDEADTVTTVKDGEFHEVRWILEDKACEHFLAIRSENEAGVKIADRLAEKKADHDISFSKKRMALENMKKELGGLEGDITDMVKVNPWLEERAAGQMTHLSTTNSMIETMEAEVEEEKYTRFKEYSSLLDLMELQLPPSIGGEEMMDDDPAEGDDNGMADEVPTLAVIASENDITSAEESEELEEEEAPPEAPKKKLTPKKEKTAFAEVKKEKTKAKMETMPQADLPPEIKKTIFRMNRRLYNLEKKVEPLSNSRTTEMKRLREDTSKLKNDTKTLQTQIRQAVDSQNKRIEASSQALVSMLADETKKAKRFAIGMGVTAIIMALIALMLILYDMEILVI